MSSLPSSLPLDPVQFPLWGSRLIEASAGTGKTYTIAALYVRLILGHGAEQGFNRPLRPPEILVMTFTRAATRELSDRIRQRLLGAASAFRSGVAEESDLFLQQLLQAYPEPEAKENAAWLLASAADAMEEAAVHTIDAWCLRMLREHAFDSASRFDEQLAEDDDELLQTASRDYWRSQVYPLTQVQLAEVFNVWANPEALFKSVRALQRHIDGCPTPAPTLAQTIEQALADQQQALQALKAQWTPKIAVLKAVVFAALKEGNACWNMSRLQDKRCKTWFEALAAWSSDPRLLAPKLTTTAVHRLSATGLQEARNNKGPSWTPPADLPDISDLLHALNEIAPPSVAMRWHALAHVHARWLKLKQARKSYGFDDLLRRLNAALTASNGEVLRRRIIEQTPVALIDEFQDTSAAQYQLFDALYRIQANDPSTAIFLIGDPKQSIYGFRGAEIYSYLRARSATQGRHYVLATNFRATHALVATVNALFSKSENLCKHGAFGFGGKPEQANPLPFVAVAAHGRKEQLGMANGPLAALQLQWSAEEVTVTQYLERAANDCAAQVVDWLNDPHCGFTQDQQFTRLCPADIAILVRNRREANSIRKALGQRNVASVYLSDKQSVFTSIEADGVLRWLQAVAEPSNVNLVRTAFASAMLNFSLSELAQLAQDDETFDQRLEQLRDLHQVWNTQGVLAMLRQTLHTLELPARWLQDLSGERRLSNYLHLAELLQTASSTLEGRGVLITWLNDAMQAAEAGEVPADEQIIRLESDADLVKVITVHKSKGLEYPVVCFPFPCNFREVSTKNTSNVVTRDADGNAVAQLQLSDSALQYAKQERLQEDIRLLYVALTRARHLLWLRVVPLKYDQALEITKSALGYVLLGDVKATSEMLQAGVTALADHPEASVCVRTITDPAPSICLKPRGADSALAQVLVYNAHFDKRWNISSFSALTRAIHSLAANAQINHPPRPGDDENTIVETTNLPAFASNNQSWHGFERGPLAGNFLHDQLEWLAKGGFNLSPECQAALMQRCARAGRGEQAELICQWMSMIVQTPLPGPNAPLQALDRVLPEMEFWLPTESVPVAELDALCRQYLLNDAERPVLPERDVHGMLLGFMDLVFCHNGKYWVLDYKSNYLGPDAKAYTQPAMQATMAHHRYDVQAALYLLALHKLLKVRLGNDYQPAQHLGGAIYFFVRGCEGPSQGIYTLAPPTEMIHALERCMMGAEQAA